MYKTKTVADTDIEERSSFTRFPKYSQVFPNIPKYSQVYLNIPLFHPQEDPSRMELSLGQPGREKIAKTAWEGNSTIICSDFVGRTFAQDDHPPPCS